MKAVWDPAKAAANLRKHGVRFADAEGALLDALAITIEDASENERRFVTIGVDTIGRIVVVAYTYRGDDVLEAFRERADAEGRGYQTMINEALRGHLDRAGERVNAETIRRIVREELRKTG